MTPFMCFYIIKERYFATIVFSADFKGFTNRVKMKDISNFALSCKNEKRTAVVVVATNRHALFVAKFTFYVHLSR